MCPVSTGSSPLREVPEAQLLVKQRNTADPQVRERITAALAAVGVDPGRLRFEGSAPDWAAHMAAYSIDLDVDATLGVVPLPPSRPRWAPVRYGRGRCMAKTRRIELRAMSEDRELMDRAAATLGTDRSSFVITSVRAAGSRSPGAVGAHQRPAGAACRVWCG